MPTRSSLLVTVKFRYLGTETLNQRRSLTAYQELILSDLHVFLQGKMFETKKNGTIKATMVTMTYLPHLKPPKIVSWSLHPPAFKNMILDILEKDIMNPNHIRARELEILQLTAEGKTMSLISDKLNISDRTVEKHLENMRFRFNCQNSAQLITFALEMNLL